MAQIVDYRVNILHENTTKLRSPIFPTVEEAQRWARQNLNPAPYASKHGKAYAARVRIPVKDVERYETAHIMGRKEGLKNHTKGVDYVTHDPQDA